jgi:hypothetical protein
LKNSSNPIFIHEPLGNNTILYWPSGKNTLIVVFSNYCDSIMTGIQTIKIVEMYSGLDKPAQKIKPKVKGKPAKEGNKDEILDEYLKWSKYMLKTEVVPPVCPACPSCKNGSGGLCTDCGGNGGCGTKSDNGKSLAIHDEKDSTKKMRGPTGAVESVGNLVEGTIGTAANLVGGTIGTASNLVGGTIGTASNLVGGTIGTAADLIKSTGKGVTNLLTGDMSRVGYNQSYVNPTATANGYNRNNTGIATMGGAPIDTYSYNGALQSKGSNFRPITANFQAFSK